MLPLIRCRSDAPADCAGRLETCRTNCACNSPDCALSRRLIGFGFRRWRLHWRRRRWWYFSALYWNLQAGLARLQACLAPRLGSAARICLQHLGSSFLPLPRHFVGSVRLILRLPCPSAPPSHFCSPAFSCPPCCTPPLPCCPLRVDMGLSPLPVQLRCLFRTLRLGQKLLPPTAALPLEPTRLTAWLRPEPNTKVCT